MVELTRKPFYLFIFVPNTWNKQILLLLLADSTKVILFYELSYVWTWNKRFIFFDFYSVITFYKVLDNFKKISARIGPAVLEFSCLVMHLAIKLFICKFPRESVKQLLSIKKKLHQNERNQSMRYRIMTTFFIISPLWILG